MRVQIVFFIYISEIGLPDFIKKPVLAGLSKAGLEVEFHRLRWRWNRGFVAENFYLARNPLRSSPEIFINEAEIRLNPWALCYGQFDIESLAISDGRFSWWLPATDIFPEQHFEITNIKTELVLLPDNGWHLTGMQADCFGAQLHLDGVITNLQHPHRS